MILIVGGLASGKRTYARSLGYHDSDMSPMLDSDASVLVDAQELARSESADVHGLVERIAARKEAVLCCEMGCGIVPLAADERSWRERAGALASGLAARADAVVRMSCGIPQVLKGPVGFGRGGAPAGSIAGAAEAAGETALPATDPEPPSGDGAEPGLETPHGESLAALAGLAGASFFANRACEHFPCHEGVPENEFNCLFCYCPLYALGPDCGGDFTYTTKGRKNCSACIVPHIRDNGVKLVAARYAELADLASS